MCNNPWYSDDKYDALTGKKIPLPCGVCQGCRIDYLIKWSRRLTAEYIKAPSAYVTFTYDDYHLRYKSGSVYPTVSLTDFSNYIDSIRHKLKYYHERLRFPVPDNNNIHFKYFCCSEYSPENQRPHYHALFFGLDFQAYGKFFKETWPYGSQVKVLPILRGGIRYVLKYIEKLQFGNDRDINYHDLGRDAPFMSCSPGIGKEFYLSQIDNINKYGLLKVGNRFIPIEPYWKNKLFNFCDKNVYRVAQFKDNRIQSLDSFARSHGYNNYDNYMVSLRKQLEIAQEKSLIKQHSPIHCISSRLSTVKHSAPDWLYLNTSPVWLEHLDKIN